jgi:hypothetical protein
MLSFLTLSPTKSPTNISLTEKFNGIIFNGIIAKFDDLK